jgi:hypothetical protein
VITNALKAARHALRRRHQASAMRGDDLGDGFGHARLQSDMDTFLAAWPTAAIVEVS